MEYCDKLFKTPESLTLQPDDWENIPRSIPATFELLQGEIHGIVRMLKEVVRADRMVERKFDCVEEVEILQMKLSKNAAEVAKAVGEVRALGNVQEDLWNELYKMRRESEKVMQYVKEAKGPAIGKLEERDEPQHKGLAMWSINCLKKLITDTVNESEAKKLIEAREFDLMHLDEEIEQIVRFNEKLIENVSGEIESLHSRLTSNARAAEEYNSLTKLEQERIKKRADELVGEIEGIKRVANDTKNYSDLVSNKMTAAMEEVEKKISAANQTIANTISRVKKRKATISQLEKVQKEASDLISGLTGRVDKQDSILELFKDALEQQGRLKKLEASMNNTKSELKSMINDTLEGVKSDVTEIKAEVFKKLENADKEMKGLEQRMESVTQSLEQWALKVIKPAQSNEAKIFTFETRLKEEETQRMKDAGNVKDNIKKLIYALEQYGLGKVDKENEEVPVNGSGAYSDNENNNISEEELEGSLMLPPVERRRESPQRYPKPIFNTSLYIDTTTRCRLTRKKTAECPKIFTAPELMLLKRLNYLKRLLGCQFEVQGTLEKPNVSTLGDFRRFRRKRRVKLRREAPNLVVEAKKVVQESRKKNVSGQETEEANVSVGKQGEFDYKSERQKHGNFKNYVAAIQQKNPNDKDVANTANPANAATAEEAHSQQQ